MRMRDRLEQLGLDQYADAFDQHQVTLDLIADLTDRDLKDIGVASLGHRKQLLRAFASMDIAETPPETAAAEDTDRALDQAERRQITVLFCDLVGSTRLSEQLDPEDLGALIGRYRQEAGGVVERYQGHVAQYQGDGMLAYFGWPQAHEDDAGRAVRAGLEIVAAVEAIESAQPLKVRIGAATGPVVVGQATDDAQEQLAVGETPRIAEQMQSLAGAGELVIAASTQRLVGNAFDVAAIDDHAPPGALDATEGWRVTGISETEERFGAFAAAPLPLVGRDTELALIQDRWQRTKEGEGQVFLLCGEPGIGKSRIARAFRDELTAERCFRFRYQCLPYYTNTVLHPISHHFERVAGFTRDDDDDARLDKLHTALSESGRDNAQSISLMAAMLSIDTKGRYPELEFAPQVQREMVLHDLVEQVVSLSKKRPVLMTFEDAHWIDPTSQQSLDLLVPRLATERVMLLVTHRPGYEPSWSNFGQVTRATLSRLGRRQAAEISANIKGAAALSESIRNEIIVKADGVPLFVEELTRALVDGKDGAAGGEAAVTVQATLQDSLMARLDQLGPGKQIAQIGACAGRTFSHELLASIAPMPAAALDDGLHALLESGLVYRAGTPPDATYSFKHALVQDTAYASLLRRNRREIHGRIADALQQDDAVEPEIVAEHFALADRPEKALPLLIVAGRAAIGRSAGDEALAHLNRALSLLEKTPESDERDQQEAVLHMMRGNALIPRSGYTAPDTYEAFMNAYRLARKLNDPKTLPPALYGLWAHQWMSRDYAVSIDTAEEALAFAETTGDAGLLVVAHRLAGMSYGVYGALQTACDHLQEAADLYDPAAHGHLALTVGQDPGVAALSNLSLLLWYLGHVDRAMTIADQALERAEASAHPQTLAYAYSNRVYFDYFRGDLTATEGSLERTAVLAKTQRLGFYADLEVPMSAWLQANKGDAADVLGSYEKGLDVVRRSGNLVTLAVQLAGLARCYAMAGRGAEAMDTINSTIAEAEQYEENYALPFLLIAKADCALLADPPDPSDAETSLLRAVEIAGEQNNLSWRLRAATGLAELLHKRDRDGEARALLAPLYDEFTEGFGTPDLQRAKAVLDRLTA